MVRPVDTGGTGHKNRSTEARPCHRRPSRRPRLARRAIARARRAEGLDDARALVAEDHVRRARPLAINDVQVGAAHARRDHPNGDLPPAGRVKVQGFGLEPAVRAVEHDAPDGDTHPGTSIALCGLALRT